MINRRLFVSVAFVIAAGCGGKSPYIDGFNPPKVQPGYTRLVTPVITGIQPGQDVTYCQWVQAPADHDVDVLHFTGAQSQWGHHVVLYADTANSPVGTSHVCNNTDMLSVRIVGGIGGEGASTATKLALPDGVVLRIPAGQSLMANVHFINVGKSAIDGQAVLDLELADPSPSVQVAGFFANVGDQISVAPFTVGTLDVNCPSQADMGFFAFVNHMHAEGASIFTELVHADGTKTPVWTDQVWQPEFSFNPNFGTWPVTSLLNVKSGDTIHTHCEWNNQTASTLIFPTEMCVGAGFYLPGGNNDILCSDGQWGTQ